VETSIFLAQLDRNTISTRCLDIGNKMHNVADNMWHSYTIYYLVHTHTAPLLEPTLPKQNMNQCHAVYKSGNRCALQIPRAK